MSGAKHMAYAAITLGALGLAAGNSYGAPTALLGKLQGCCPFNNLNYTSLINTALEKQRLL